MVSVALPAEMELLFVTLAVAPVFRHVYPPLVEKLLAFVS
jgi:hypothetical protein